LGLSFDAVSGGRLLNAVDVVWYRKPRKLTADEMPVDKKYQGYSHSAYSGTVDMLFGLLRNKLWVNNYWAIKVASNKLFQLEVAAQLGMNIPHTLVTSRESEAYHFVNENGGPVVAKMTGTQHVSYDGSSYVFYTSRIETNPDLSGLSVAPGMFQVEINKLVDLRVTVVGNKVFACEVHQHGKFKNKIDWREGVFEEGALTYELHKKFPKGLHEKCIVMLKRLGLVFGAFDFILDKNGKYWFLEVNPNGQWGFVELEGNIRISPAFIEVFRQGCN